MIKKILLIMLCVTLSSAAFAVEKLDKKQALEMTQVFSDCTGFYRASSEMAMELLKDADLSKSYEEIANGAQITALYFADSIISDKEKARKYVENSVDTAKTTFRVLIKQNSADTIGKQKNKCASYANVQAETVQTLKNRMYGVE